MHIIRVFNAVFALQLPEVDTDLSRLKEQVEGYIGKKAQLLSEILDRDIAGHFCLLHDRDKYEVDCVKIRKSLVFYICKHDSNQRLLLPQHV